MLSRYVIRHSFHRRYDRQGNPVVPACAEMDMTQSFKHLSRLANLTPMLEQSTSICVPRTDLHNQHIACSHLHGSELELYVHVVDLFRAQQILISLCILTARQIRAVPAVFRLRLAQTAPQPSLNNKH